MSQYKFRLEALRRMRIMTRDQHRASLAEAFRAEEALTERQAEVANERLALRNSGRAALASHYLDVNKIVELQRYESVLKLNESHLAEQSAQLKIEIERRRLAMVEADRAVRVLDKLDERHRTEHRRAELRQETKQLDEIAVMRRVPLES